MGGREGVREKERVGEWMKEIQRIREKETERLRNPKVDCSIVLITNSSAAAESFFYSILVFPPKLSA